MMGNRIEWIDIAKGLGILIVIAGHTISLGYSYPLYAFHMPLFFFLSGLVFRDKDDNFNSFLISKTKSLIKPWIIILLISFLVCLSIPQWRNALTTNALLSDFYTANTNTLQNSSLWYLICFYFVLLIFFFIRRLNLSKKNILIFVGIAIALLWIKSIMYRMPLPFHRLPLKIDSAFIALVFFTIAFNLKEKILFVMSRTVKLVYIITIVVISGILCVLNGWSNINSLDFGNIRLLYYPIAFLGIASVCLISQLLSASIFKRFRLFFAFYGKNSLLIFGFQSLFIRLYLLFFNDMQGLNMKLYDDNPIIHQIGSFFVVSFIMCPVVVYIFDFLRKRNIRIL